MEDTVQQRLKNYLGYKDISINKFEKSINAATGFVGNMRLSMSPNKIKSIAQIYSDLNIGWLLTGNGDMMYVKDDGGIPLYRAEAAAGFGTPNFSIEEKDIEARYRVREFVDASFMLYVHGKSMEPLYNSGDIIAVKIEKDIENIHWGKVYLISSKEDGLLIKRIYDHGTDIICISENPTFSPIFVHKSDIKGLASVKGTIRIESL